MLKRPDGWLNIGQHWLLYQNGEIIGIVRARVTDEKYAVIVNTSTMKDIGPCDTVEAGKVMIEVHYASLA